MPRFFNMGNTCPFKAHSGSQHVSSIYFILIFVFVLILEGSSSLAEMTHQNDENCVFFFKIKVH
jgi:hypothetical protein